MYLPRPHNGWWILEDRNMQINLRDTIQYNITLVYKNGFYTTVRGEWTVSGKFDL